MAYKKKYVPKKRTFKKRKSVVKTLAKKVNTLYKNIETKHYRIDGIGALPDNNPTLAIRPYPNVTQGLLDYGNRVGDKITVKYVRFKSTWELGAGFAPRVGRVIAFIMKSNPDGIAVAWSTIYNLFMESAYSNTVNIVNSNQDYDNRQNFHVLYDEKRTFNLDEATLSKQIVWDVSMKIPQKYQTVQYFGGGTTVSRNELFIALISNVDGGLSINYLTEFYYSDT